MKRFGLLVLTTLFVTLTCFGETLTQAERDRAARHLEATRQALLEATAGLSEAQWNFKPGPERWSAAEIAEHLAVSEDFLFQNITEQVLKTPPSSEERDSDEVKAVDDLVLAAIADRSKKVQAPPQLVPTGRFGSPQKTMQHFLNSRAQTLDFVRTTSADLRAHAVDSPLGKKLDAYQQILFISAHTERHTKQLNEVKVDPQFPVN